MRIIGLIGEKGSGKGLFTAMLKNILGIGYDKKVERVSSSDILFETLNKWGVETSRVNLQKLAEAMDRVYGAGTLSRAVMDKISRSDADIVVFDSVRWQTDFDAVKSLGPDSILLYITAPAELRYERRRGSSEKAGESEIAWDEFLAQEDALTERDIPRLGAQADFTILNYSSELCNFEDQILRFCKTFQLQS